MSHPLYKHPMYNNPEYDKAVKDHEWAVAELRKAQAKEYDLWNTILRMEAEYKAMSEAEYKIKAVASDDKESKEQQIK